MMNPILKRTLSGLGVGALVIGLFLYCPLRALMPIVLVLSTFAQLEFYMMAKKKYEPVTWFGLLMGAVCVVMSGVLGFGKGLMWLGAFLYPALLASFAILCLIVLFRARYRNPVGSIAVTLMGFLYVPFLLSFFLLVPQLTCCPWMDVGAPESRAGLYTLFALIAVAKFSDTGGFAFGMAFGKHKMCPTISPKKSWEGLVGSMLFSAATACVCLALARRFGWGETVRFWDALNYPGACACGAATALLATAGDLVESRFKRACGVKDSATFMPAGMGGFLDMFDSILFIPALVYYPLFCFNLVGP